MLMNYKLRVNSFISGVSVISISVGAVGLWAQNTLPVPPPGGKPVVRSIGKTPGLESFAVPPKTPFELVEAIDYLIRVGHEAQALPLAQKLTNASPDAETLLEIRNQIGSAKLLTMQSSQNPQLNALMVKFADSVAQASTQLTTDKGRIRRLIAQLSASKEESELASERLSRLGSQVVGFLVDAYTAPDVTPETRTAIQKTLNDLEISAVPGLLGVLRHPDTQVQIAVIQALGSIDDPRALPWLVFQSTRKGEVGAAAKKAVDKLNHGHPIPSPMDYLKNASASYLDHDVEFATKNVELWNWDNQQKMMVSRSLDQNGAKGAIGYRLARLALDLDPTDESSQTIALSTLLQEESDRLGQAFPQADPAGVWSMALASGPKTLENVLKRAMTTGRHERVAVLAVQALGQVVSTSDLVVPGGQPHILVKALSSPDRRVQFAAAKALVDLDPSQQFPGSSRVVPVLSRFLLSNPALPRAVVIHNHIGEGSDWTTYLKAAGYDATLEASGRDGFSEIARRGDAELVLISTHLDPTSWTLPETISNIKADSRTAGVPVIVVGPLDAKYRLQTLLGNTPGLGFMISPANQQIAERQIAFQLKKIGKTPLTTDQRVEYSNEASHLLGQLIAGKRPNSMTAMLGSLEPHIYKSLKASLPPSEPIEKRPARKDLLERVLQSSLPKPERAAAALELSGEIQATGLKLSQAELQKVNPLFLTLEQKGELEILKGLAPLVGVNKPDRRTVSEIFLKFAPLGDNYESIQKKQ